MTKKQDGNPYIIIFALWLLLFAASSQVMIISPILPRIAEQLSTSIEVLGNLVTVYAVMVGFFAIIMGPLSDKIGRRMILLIGTGSISFFLFLHGFVDTFWELLAVRALAGMAGGVLSGAAVAYVGDYFPYEKRGWANGWIMSGMAMGQILGIPIGTLMADLYGFRIPFLIFAGIMLLTFLLILAKVPQPNVELSADRVTFKGSLNKYLKLLKRSEVRAVAFAYVVMFLSISVFVVYLPTWLEDSFNVSGKAIASLFFVGGIANVITGPLAGKLSDHIGRKKIIIVSCLGLSVVMAITTLVITEFWISYIVFFFTMVLIAMRISPFQALSTQLIKSDNRGSLMSLLVAIGQVGYGIGGSIAGPFYVESGYMSNTLIGTLMILIMAYIVWRHVPEPELNTESGTKFADEE
ncbi:MFS transporter [Gracilimonas mengyeensis]|uniref:Predicted arabinose efflux permease, MFS family n=1 Tax=Gracilimonas mengyeensis TaxID=1302730 RepID=A0A521AR07_9BACT|nr:MFS transporter [Gracilimonas mengyeensis]SMO37215.1 Predicted arabinose efflux permease, MFS family [Gracilimonas mengyeensis]